MEDEDNWKSKFESCEYSDKLIHLVELLNQGMLDPVDIIEIQKAIYCVRKYHGSQLRKSGHPYYYHPLEVGGLFLEHVIVEGNQYYTTDLAVVAILHDVLEDTTFTYDMIIASFNSMVASKVKSLTRIKNNDGIKITAADTLISSFLANKIDVMYIKMFDRLHNMQTIDAMPPEKAKIIATETIRYFVPFSMLFGMLYVSEELTKLSEDVIIQNSTKQYEDLYVY